MSVDLWYSPAEIRFTREQMIFLILSMDLLSQGAYPPDSKGTGYTDPAILSKAKSHKAPFETPIQFHAELKSRLDKTGTDGKLLVAEVRAEYTFGELSREASTALDYISGWRRRKMDYTSWKKQGRYRGKTLVI